MGFLKLFKKKNPVKDKQLNDTAFKNEKLHEKSASDVAVDQKFVDPVYSDSSNFRNDYGIAGISEIPEPSANSRGFVAASESTSASSVSASTKRKSSFSLMKKASFGTIDTSISNNTKEMKVKKVTDLPEELLPVVTLISHQQSRNYYTGNAYFYHQTSNIDLYEWSSAFVQLTGSDISVQVDGGPKTFINVCDCELAYDRNENYLSVSVTKDSVLSFKFNTAEELNGFYSSILLCKFEYQQLQEAYTGALLSSQAIHFSDIKTLLSPINKNIKEEWSVVRFPFLNDKWIRCLIVVKPSNKIEIYLNSSKSKKYLLATITNGQSAYTIYSNDPSQVQNNSLLRLYGNCYINSDLLESVVTKDDLESIKSKKMRSRTSSLSKRLSLSSLRSDDNKSLSMHKRADSIDTTVSEHSFNNSKTPKKLINKNLINTHLIYLIPESHASVRPVEIMLRMLIPMLNSFSLYGRPTKFISSRTDPNSLLFGLPQLPNTYYLNTKSANDLVTLNLGHSLVEEWTSSDWNFIFKELLSTLMEKGWKGGSFYGDVAHLNISVKNKPVGHQDNSYDPMDDFNDRSSFANRSLSIPV